MNNKKFISVDWGTTNLRIRLVGLPCAGGKLFQFYHKAMAILDLLPKTQIVSKEIVDVSVIKGQYQILHMKRGKIPFHV